MALDDQTNREIFDAVERWLEATRTGSVAKVLSCYAPEDDISGLGSGPDEIGLGPTGVVEQFTRTLQDTTDIGWKFHWYRVGREGTVAWIYGDTTLTATVNGTPLDLEFRFTIVFVHRDGQWLIKHSHVAVPDPRQAVGESWPTLIDAVATEVGREQPDLRMQAAIDGTVTLLFSDIENSTGLTDELGDLRWMELLREHNAIVRERIGAYGGREVKTIGDAFMVAFPAARRAVLCAIDLQRAFSAYSEEHPGQPIKLRIGMHAGEPVREGGDFYGKSVILASRIAGEARGEEVLVSSLLKELTDSAGDISFDAPREYSLKGFAGTEWLFPVRWQL